MNHISIPFLAGTGFLLHSHLHCYECSFHRHCSGCSQKICIHFDSVKCECELSNQKFLKISKNSFLTTERALRLNNQSISFPYFTPIIDLTNECTHIWKRGFAVSAVIIPYFPTQFDVTLLQEFSVPIILQLPSQERGVNPSLSESGIREVSSLSLLGVITGVPLDLRDLPKNATWRAIDRSLIQVETFLHYFDFPIVVSLPGAYLDQMKLAVKRLNDLGIKQVVLRGGMYTLIKLHARINTFLDIIYQYDLQPILFWDLWWVPSRSLRVKHFYGASWWQFGLQRVKFDRKKHFGCHFLSPFSRKGPQKHTSIPSTTQIIDCNYQFLVTGIAARNAVGEAANHGGLRTRSKLPT